LQQVAFAFASVESASGEAAGGGGRSSVEGAGGVAAAVVDLPVEVRAEGDGELRDV
jgi:hypothetical protein